MKCLYGVKAFVKRKQGRQSDVEGLTAASGKHQGRIIAVADVYDALTSERPYRNALSKEAAIKEIKAHSGKQFNPDVVEIFVQIVAER